MKSRTHKDSPATKGHSGNKSVKSDITYQRYTDWDSISGSTIVDVRDERSYNSYERHTACSTEARDAGNLNCRPRPQHDQQFRSQTGSSAQRGSSFQPHVLNAEDETSVRTSITNSRSVTSPERQRRNSRYEPAASRASYSVSTTNSRDEMPTVVRTRSKNRPRAEASVDHSYGRGSMSYKSDRVGTVEEAFPSVNSISHESRLLGQSNCYSSVGTDTIVSNKPPLGPRGHSRTQDSTPRANNITSLRSIENRRVKLRQSNTSVSSFTRDDETLTLDNSIPSALEFSNQSAAQATFKSESNTIYNDEVKYWMDLSVHAAISVLQAKGSEYLAEKAATTVVEAGQRIKSREKKRDMQQVLRFLATKTSVAVLEAGGNQKVATAVAHAIMTHSTPRNDMERARQDDIDRSAMINQIDKSIGHNIKKKSLTRISELSKVQKDELSEKVNKSSSKLHTPESSQLTTKIATQRSDCTFSSATSKESNVAGSLKVSSQIKRNPAYNNGNGIQTAEVATEKSTIIKNSDRSISHLSVSYEKPCQHDENESCGDKQNREEADELHAQKEQEFNEKMAALDAATNALLAKANNMQYYIDHVVQKQPADASYFRAPNNNEFQTVFSCDDPGFHNNFNGRSFQINNQYHDNLNRNPNKEKSVLEKLTSGFSQMLEFTACATPTTGTQASSANFTSQFSAPVHLDRMPHLDCNGGIIDSNYSEAYVNSEKNDGTNDMISALTDDIPVHKKWQQHSRLHLNSDHKRPDDCYETEQLTQFFEAPQTPMGGKQKISSSRADFVPNKSTTPNQPQLSAHQKSTTDHLHHPTKESLHEAFDSAMHQLSSQMIQQPCNERQDFPLISPSEMQISNKSSSSGLGKLKSALSRKKNSHKSVSFGVTTDDLQVNTQPPKSPAKRFGGFVRKKQGHSEC